MGNTLDFLLKLQDRFSGPMRQARDETMRLKKGVGDLGGSTGAVNNLAGAFTGLAAKIGAAFTVYKALETGFGGLKKSLEVASSMETTQTAFKTMLGSSQAMLQTLGDIKKLAAETPFEFPELATAGKMLLAFGVAAGEIPATLRRIGDVSSGIAAPIGEIAEIFGKCRTQGQLFAEDINQLTGRGIPIIREFAKILGLPESAVKKLAEEGKITFPLLDQAFRNLTGAGGQFFDMMAEQSKTSAGLWSTLLDGVNDLFLAFGTPLNDAIKPVLTDAMGLLGQVQPLVAELGNDVGAMVKSMRDFVAEAGNGASLGSAMGTAISAALSSAFEKALIPFKAAWAGMSSMGKDLMDWLAPVGGWLTGKMLAAAELFCSKLLTGLATALESLPMKMGEAGGQLARAAALQHSVAGMQHGADADDAGEKVKPASSEGVWASLEKGMGAVRDQFNKDTAPKPADPNALPKSVLDNDYNPLLPNGPLPAGASPVARPGEGALGASALDPHKTPLEEAAAAFGRDKGKANPLSGGTAAGAKEAIANATASKGPSKEDAAKKQLELEELGNKLLEAKIAGNEKLQAQLEHQLAIAREMKGLMGQGANEKDAKDRAEKKVGLEEKLKAIKQAEHSSGSGGGAQEQGRKGPLERVKHMMGGGDQGPLSARGTSGIRRHMMGGGDKGPLSTRKATPTVPSPGTTKRSQERREATAKASRGGGSDHPLMGMVKAIQQKLDSLAVAK
jgi:tape measure domain-containing protein